MVDQTIRCIKLLTIAISAKTEFASQPPILFTSPHNSIYRLDFYSFTVLFDTMLRYLIIEVMIHPPTPTFAKIPIIFQIPFN